MASVHKKVHQWTQQKNRVGQNSQQVRAVLCPQVERSNKRENQKNYAL